MHINHNKILKVFLLLLFMTANTAIVSFMILKLLNRTGQTEKAASSPMGITEVSESDVSGADVSGADVSEIAESLNLDNHLTPEADIQSKNTDSAIKTALIGGLLNSTLPADEYIVFSDGFYYAPLSENLRKYLTGNSYPKPGSTDDPVIHFSDLMYVHVLYIGFDGLPAEGELICNKVIAQELTEIFQELYQNSYPIEKIRLIDEYYGDDAASMDDNNTSCFNYRANSSTGSRSLSLHAYGLAVDINPLYNPYILTDNSGNSKILPESGAAYCDRSAEFEHKIDENDFCYKIFTAHGFTWGGNWTGAKDYQHFEKKTK